MRVVAIAGVVAAAIVAAGVALQAEGLPPPARGDVIAARAAQWLTRYHYATSTLRLGGRTIGARCFHGWFGGSVLHDDRGTILELANGASVRALPRRLAASRLPRGLRPLDALDLAGCTGVLGTTLDALAVAGAAHVRHETAWGEHVLALRFRRLAVLVDPVTDRPLGVELPGARSRIRLVPMTAALRARLEALR